VSGFGLAWSLGSQKERDDNGKTPESPVICSSRFQTMEGVSNIAECRIAKLFFFLSSPRGRTYAADKHN